MNIASNKPLRCAECGNVRFSGGKGDHGLWYCIQCWLAWTNKEIVETARVPIKAAAARSKVSGPTGRWTTASEIDVPASAAQPSLADGVAAADTVSGNSDACRLAAAALKVEMHSKAVIDISDDTDAKAATPHTAKASDDAADAPPVVEASYPSQAVAEKADASETKTSASESGKTSIVADAVETSLVSESAVPREAVAGDVDVVVARAAFPEVRRASNIVADIGEALPVLEGAADGAYGVEAKLVPEVVKANNVVPEAVRTLTASETVKADEAVAGSGHFGEAPPPPVAVLRLAEPEENLRDGFEEFYDYNGDTLQPATEHSEFHTSSTGFSSRDGFEDFYGYDSFDADTPRTDTPSSTSIFRRPTLGSWLLLDDDALEVGLAPELQELCSVLAF